MTCGQWKIPPRYNWNNLESCVKHHKPNKTNQPSPFSNFFPSTDNHWQLKSEMSKENYCLLAEIKFGKPEMKNKSNKIIV